MLTPLEMLEKQVSRTDQQLLLHLVREQQETNRLLREMAGQQEPKRPELMKRMASLKDKPAGFHKWSNDQIIDYLKGVPA